MSRLPAERLREGGERERERAGNIKEQGITPLSLSCGLSRPELSKTTAAPTFHLTKFKDDFGNTSFSSRNSLGLCSSLVHLLFSVCVSVTPPLLPPFPSPSHITPFFFSSKPSLWLLRPPGSGVLNFGIVDSDLWQLQQGQISSLGIHYLRSIIQIHQRSPKQNSRRVSGRL